MWLDRIKNNFGKPENILSMVATAARAITTVFDVSLHHVGMKDKNQTRLTMNATNPSKNPRAETVLEKYRHKLNIKSVVIKLHDIENMFTGI